jgi:hypothetical protein
MPATITRKRPGTTTAAATTTQEPRNETPTNDLSSQQVTENKPVRPAERPQDRQSRRQPAQKSATDESSLLAGLELTVGELPVAKRGGAGRDPIPVDPNVRKFFSDMLQKNDNGEGKTKFAQLGPVTLTNKFIQQQLVNGVSKLCKELPDDLGDWVKSTITVTDDSPNKRDASADAADKPVNIIWTVRYRTDDEQAKYVKAKSERRSRSHSA